MVRSWAGIGQRRKEVIEAIISEVKFRHVGDKIRCLDIEGEPEVEIIREDYDEIALVARVENEVFHIVWNNTSVEVLPDQERKGGFLLVVWSKTYRGSSEQTGSRKQKRDVNKKQVRDVVYNLSLLGITNVRACFDEDYGWCSQVDQDFIDNCIFKKEEYYNVVKIINLKKAGWRISAFNQEIATIYPNPREGIEVTGEPLEVSFSSLWGDWSKNYGI